MIPIKKIYLSIAMFGIISTLLVVFVMWPLFKEIKAISQNLFLKKNKIVYLSEERENIKKIENLYKTYQSDLDRIENLFVDPEVPIEFIGFLEKSATDSQIKLEISSMTRAAAKGENEATASLTTRAAAKGENEATASLTTRAAARGGDEQSSATTKKTEQEPWQSLSAQLLVTGSFSNFSKFLHKLENGPYLIETVDLNTRRLAEKDIQVKELENIPGADTTTVLSIKVFAK